MRDNASRLIRRLRVAPARVYPPSLHHRFFSCGSLTNRDDPGAGLAGEDVLFVGNCEDFAGQGSRLRVLMWSYVMGAQHALRGGRVVYAIAPGSGGFQLRLFVECLEKLTLENENEEAENGKDKVEKKGRTKDAPADSTTPAGKREESTDDNANGRIPFMQLPPCTLLTNSSGANDFEGVSVWSLEENLYSEIENEDCHNGADVIMTKVWRLREKIARAMELVDVIQCRNVEDFYVFCRNYTFPPVVELHNEESNQNDEQNASPSVVPLVFVKGYGGKGSYFYHYERAAGEEIPLRQWLFQFLQRRLRCALILQDDLQGFRPPFENNYFRETPLMATEGNDFRPRSGDSRAFFRTLQEKSSLLKALRRPSSYTLRRFGEQPILSDNHTGEGEKRGERKGERVGSGGPQRVFYLLLETNPPPFNATGSSSYSEQWKIEEVAGGLRLRKVENGSGKGTPVKAPLNYFFNVSFFFTVVEL
ncbi:unnamed protein product [Phytomonas sp. Hart1]|nr:unnamed protein product [Phytomonas sp. Hart1]|eukprot:CCW72115.1 unnamed protein product [Phytomonas sp. isolate Hart1]